MLGKSPNLCLLLSSLLFWAAFFSKKVTQRSKKVTQNEKKIFTKFWLKDGLLLSDLSKAANKSMLTIWLKYPPLKTGVKKFVCLWSKLSDIWMVRQVMWLYNLNTGHPYCLLFRWIWYSDGNYQFRPYLLVHSSTWSLLFVATAFLIMLRKLIQIIILLL